MSQIPSVTADSDEAAMTASNASIQQYALLPVVPCTRVPSAQWSDSPVASTVQCRYSTVYYDIWSIVPRTIQVRSGVSVSSVITCTTWYVVL